MITYTVGEYTCKLVTGETSKVTYMIYPAVVPLEDPWLEEMALLSGGSLAVVLVPGPMWNDSLTPWPEPGETRDAQPFGGKAPEFLRLLTGSIVPETEQKLGTPVEKRNLVGVSLSGLFTLWQWIQNDTFGSIACLSGSFWYEGFLEWFDSQPVPRKQGKAFFLLGDKEPEAHIKAFRSVGVNTEAIVKRLKDNGINVCFEWVPGNHFADPQGRIRLALLNLR